jgi:hypothetical protein
MKIGIILAVRNRLNLTKNFIDKMEASAHIANVKLKWLIFDDGSTDGTYDYVSTINVDKELHVGDGGVYWSESCLKILRGLDFTPYDSLLIANDDQNIELNFILKFKDSVQSAPSNWGAISGQVLSKSGEIIYGGYQFSRPFKFKLQKFIPTAISEFHHVDSCNGNLLFLNPRYLSKLRYPQDRVFYQNSLDHWLSLSSRRYGFACYVNTSLYSSGESNVRKTWFFNADSPLSARLKGILGPMGIPFKTHFYMTISFSGILFPVAMLYPYFKCIFFPIKSNIDIRSKQK